MNYKKNEQNKLLVSISNELEVELQPNSKHDFLMSTKDVAAGYGITTNTLRSHKRKYRNELSENKHFISGVDIINAGYKTKSTMWTKLGIIRLGFFIKSERAKFFRDWAENVVLEKLTAPKPVKALPIPPKRKHNRLTSDRLLSIMADVCKIEDKEVRMSITDKLLGGQ